MKYQVVLVMDDANEGRGEKRGDQWIFPTRELAEVNIALFEALNGPVIDGYEKNGGSVTFTIEEIEEGGETE